MGYLMRAIKIILGILSLLLILVSRHEGQAQGSALLIDLPQSRMFETDKLVLRSKPVRFNPDILLSRSASPIVVDLFNDKKIEIVPVELKVSQTGPSSMVGRVSGRPYSEVTLIWEGERATATFNLGVKEVYRLRYLPSGVHLLEQLPHEYLPLGQPELVIEGGDQLKQTRQAAEQPSENVTIDILVLYTEKADEAIGGASGSQNMISLAEMESNLGFKNSHTNVTFNVVHSQKVAYSEDDLSFTSILRDLTGKQDGQLDDIHKIRDFYGADVVTLIVDRPLLCGKTYQNNGKYSDFSSYAFAVLHFSCVTGYYSFAHEIGHIMGSQHDRSHSAVDGSFPFSYGYQQPAHKFRTIMAYNCEVSCLRVNYWSNPNVLYEGWGVTGIDVHSAESAHNSLSLMQMAPEVSNFRQSPIRERVVTTINFQAPSQQRDADTFIDTGEAYGEKQNSLVYGWVNGDETFSGQSAEVTNETTYVTVVNHQGQSPKWELLLPNGQYKIRIVSGQAGESEKEPQLFIENQLFENEGLRQPMTDQTIDVEHVVSISDGSLSINSSSGELTLNMIEVEPVPPIQEGSTQEGSTGSTTNLAEKVYLPVVVR